MIGPRTTLRALVIAVTGLAIATLLPLQAAHAQARAPSWATARPDQVPALQELLARGGPDARVRIDARLGTLSYARGTFDVPAGPDEASARAFLEWYAPLFGLADPDRELVLESADTDRMGWHHVSFGRVHAGLPIHGDRLTLHTEPGGDLRAVTGRLHGSLSLPRAPQLDADGARFHLERALSRSWAGVTWREDGQRLHWYWSPRRNLSLAWQLHPVPIEDEIGLRALVCQVDATSGETLDCWPEAQELTYQSIAGQGQDTKGKLLTFDAAFVPELGFNVMVDATKPLAPGSVHVTLNAAG